MKHFYLILVIFAIGILIFMGFGMTFQQGNSICDPFETIIDCEDCKFPPLNMSDSQVVMASATDPTRIYQFKYINEGYVNTWVSELIPANGIDGISVGDADNDGTPDVTAVVKSTGRGRKFIKIYMYRDGSEGAPDYISPDIIKSYSFINDSIIADADDDGDNELIIVDQDTIKIFRWDGMDFINIWNSRRYPNMIFSVDVGDADNDDSNEIVLAPFSIDSAVILESLGNDVWGDEQMTEPIPEGGVFIDYAKVRDADNIDGNEIIAGGNNNRLMIWKYNDEGTYDLVFTSNDLHDFTQGVDAGDIDGDGLNEVITLSLRNDKIYRFDYNGTTYEEKDIFTYPLSYLALGNIDSDPNDEVVLSSWTLPILDYPLGNPEDNPEDTLNLTWYFPYGGKFEIWEGTNPVEPDIIPPSAVSYLSTSNSTAYSIDLTWTAPGDDGNIGTASQYDIRYSTSLITDDNWNAANLCNNEPSPSSAGSTDNFTVTGLPPNTLYHFALKTADEAPNWSALSNIPNGTTQEATTQSMHISAIHMSLKTAGPNVNAFATVTIVDGSGNAVSGATVSGDWSGATSDTDSGVTDINGQMKFTSDRLKNPNSGSTFTFTVVNVEKDGWTYDSSSNNETSIIYN